jgi:LPPG:FO 2-phospho-L-lactate transferase
VTGLGSVVALSGGVGGAKLVWGLAVAMDPLNLTVIANPGDDFEHLGLAICPDLDTVTYTLAGHANQYTGWGRANETWTFMDALESIGGETWFRLGDGDLALQVERTRRLSAGECLGDVTADICHRWGIAANIRPASGSRVRTVVETDIGDLSFQHYFVRDQCAPRVTGFRFDGASTARPDEAALASLADPSLRAVLICPSNPFISIDPILAIPGYRAAIAATSAAVIAVSPIIGGQAVKGPAAKMLEELGLAVSAQSVWRHYGDLIDAIVLDTADVRLADAARADGLDVLVTPTVMGDDAGKKALAHAILAFADSTRALAKT